MNKILIIGPFSPPITGVSTANETLFRGLKEKGITVGLINNSYPTLKDNIGNFSISKVLFYFKLFNYSKKIPKYNIIYMTPGQTFFGVLKYYPFILIAEFLNKNLIIHVHGDHLWKAYESLNGYKKKLFYWILSKFDKGIVLSPKLRRNLSPFIKSGNIYEVYNFVEDGILNNITIENIKSKDTDILNIVFLSNLMKEKGIFDLLDALLILKRKGTKFNAKIAGGIDVKLEKEIKIYFDNLQGLVEYVGVIKGEEKFNLLLNSNIFILPTYYEMEGQPISILEAMATGNIILTTNHAGISDIFVNSKNGFYINKNDPEDIVKKIEHIFKRSIEVKKIMENNFIEAKSKYTNDRFINSIYEIIK